MFRFPTRLRRGLMLGAAISLNLMIATDAWAKAAEPPAGGSSGSVNTVIAYFLVGLLIVLGLLVACRPARRASGIEDATAKAFLPSLFKKKEKGDKSN